MQNKWQNYLEEIIKLLRKHINNVLQEELC